MKKAFFGVILAFALPSIVSAQIEVITYSPSQVSPYNVILHGHVDQIDDLAVGDSVAVKFYYGTDDDVLDMQTVTLVATRDQGEHFEIPAFEIIAGEDYFCQFSASINGGPEMLGEIESFETPGISFEEPEIETNFAEHVGNNTATLVGYIEEFGSYESLEAYFRFGENPETLDMVTPATSVTDPFGQFELDIKGLTAGKIINFQACVTSPYGETCGDVEHFLTPNKGNIDVEYLSVYQEDDCQITFDFSVDMGDRPSPAPATFKIGNGGSVYTKEFWYQDWGSEGLTLDISTFEAAGIDPYDPVIVTFTVTSFGETGKTSGTIILDNFDCDEFAGDADGFRLAENDISIYPNPAVKSVFIKSTKEEATVHIMDLSGRAYANYSIANGITEISVESLPSGVYLVRYASEGNIITKKIVIE